MVDVGSTTPVNADLGAWPADVKDTCGNVFGLSLRHARPDLKSDARVLEIGCAEFNWLAPASKAWPEMLFTGIDWRACKWPPTPRVTRIEGDVMAADFAPESFEWIVGVSSIEHIGLGHYKADPQHAQGDSVTMANAFRWLAPGGWMYLDVPWNAGFEAYHVHGHSHRVYDDATIQSRLLQGFDWSVEWAGKVHCRQTNVLVTQPERLRGGEQFYYLMLWIQKGSHAATP